jgi:hypothetical protein
MRVNKSRKREWDFMDTPNQRNPHGYLPKISYWTKEWESHMEDLNEEGMKRAEEKLMYFFGRQLDLNKKDETI